MTSVHLTPSVSRKLYPILESSETSASSSIRISHSFEKDNQPSSSLHPHPYQKAPPGPSQTQSTPSSAPIKEKDNISTTYIPLFEWPVHSLSSEPQFDPELQFNEPKSKTVFSEMIDMACRLLQEPTSYPKNIYLVFDENEHLKGITLIMQDGTREDYLKFGGSLQYLAPELIDDDSSAYDYEYLEVWSLGVSLFRMLIGKYPFRSDASSDRELFKRMAMANLDIPKQISEGFFRITYTFSHSLSHLFI
ncbi:hypothetical protein EDC96DRAFT_446932 [Choanephora cucurbitarum]|nr:hypothetical protein EDC96DRAFT_446932 [Choanephora cucurbitarum]